MFGGTGRVPVRSWLLFTLLMTSAPRQLQSTADAEDRGLHKRECTETNTHAERVMPSGSASPSKGAKIAASGCVQLQSIRFAQNVGEGRQDWKGGGKGGKSQEACLGYG
uniref:Uncharacterized protein n=1 Tax=Anopheles atroparvus TaxID=41427 RepID=A0A182IVV6_ANOAO